jgi:hypothetical protein
VGEWGWGAVAWQLQVCHWVEKMQGWRGRTRAKKAERAVEGEGQGQFVVRLRRRMAGWLDFLWCILGVAIGVPFWAACMGLRG